MGSEKPHVIIVDDHAAVREGIKAYLKHHDIKIAAEASNASGALHHLKRYPEHILILDLNLDEARGVSIIESCCQQNPNALIVIYSMREAMPTIYAAYKAGAKAYITKSANLDELVNAIESAANNELYFMPGMVERIAHYDLLGKKEQSPADILTKREFSVFVELANGNGVEDTAANLNISQRTVANYVSNICSKLGTSRAEFRKSAVLHGFIDVADDV